MAEIVQEFLACMKVAVPVFLTVIGVAVLVVWRAKPAEEAKD